MLSFYLLINFDIKQHQLWHFQVLNTFQLDNNNPGLSEYIIIPEDEDEDIYSSDSLPEDDQMIFVPIGKIYTRSIVDIILSLLQNKYFILRKCHAASC